MSQTPQTSEPPRNDGKSNLALNMILAGAAGGSAIGLGTSLLNHLRSLKAEEKRLKDTTHDDDTMRVVIRQPVPAGGKLVRASLQEGMALTGGTLALLGSYGLIRRAYQKQKRAILQQQLDNAQTTYVDLLEKSANISTRPMSLSETLKGSLWTIPAILGLALAFGTDRMLEKHIPAPKSPARNAPKKLRIHREEPVVDVDAEDATPVKSASASGQTDELGEFLLHVLSGDRMRYRTSGFADLVKAASAGKQLELTAAFLSGGVDGMFKAASTLADPGQPSELDRTLASSWLCRDRTVGPSVKILLASELQDMMPGIHKVASGIPEEHRDPFIALAEDLARHHRGQLVLAQKETLLGQLDQVKNAAFHVSDVLQDLLKVRAGDSATESNLQSQGDAGDRAEPKPQPAKKVESRDPIDSFLS